MNRTIIFTLFLSLSLTTPSFANEPIDEDTLKHTEQKIGLSTGGAVGGIIAGPPGIIAGALIGSLMGQNIADEKQKTTLQKNNITLENKLVETNLTLLKLRDDSSHKTTILHDTHMTIERLVKENQELKNHALNFDIQFRTNSSNIEQQYKKYLIDLATALKSTPNMEIEIAGFSDRVGDEEYNLELSIQRAKHVKQALINHGIEEERITTLAFGESQPLHPEENLENNFFDRRVSVYLRPIDISTENIAEEIAKTEKTQEFASKL